MYGKLRKEKSKEKNNKNNQNKRIRAISNIQLHNKNITICVLLPIIIYIFITLATDIKNNISFIKGYPFYFLTLSVHCATRPYTLLCMLLSLLCVACPLNEIPKGIFLAV